jgi:hypothetical protein
MEKGRFLHYSILLSNHEKMQLVFIHFSGFCTEQAMLHWLTSLIGDMLAGHATASEKLPCFHCGELVKHRRAVHVQFDGASRIVCCHGCAAILKTVEQMGMLQQYREQKKQAAASHDD